MHRGCHRSPGPLIRAVSAVRRREERRWNEVKHVRRRIADTALICYGELTISDTYESGARLGKARQQAVSSRFLVPRHVEQRPIQLSIAHRRNIAGYAGHLRDAAEFISQSFPEGILTGPKCTSQSIGNHHGRKGRPASPVGFQRRAPVQNANTECLEISWRDRIHRHRPQ
jgi:hypothetical protein